MRTATKQQTRYQAIEYLRLSKEKKGEHYESDSITNQRKIIDDFVLYHPEIQIVDTKVDDGYTGTDFDRPGFKQLIAELKKKKINCIIVKDLSRFGRDYIECGRYIEREFTAAGIRFIAVTDGIDTHGEFSESNRYVIPVKNLMNDMYAADISLKVRSVNDALRRNGDFIAAFSVYGYRRSDKNPRQLVVDEYAAEIVKRIFSMRLKGLSYMAIANDLNREGVKSPLAYKQLMGINLKTKFDVYKNSQWSAQAIKRILHNRIYTGRLEQKKETTINYKVKNRIYLPEEEWLCKDHAHTAIIHERLFEIVSSIDACGAISPDNIFAGLIECGVCQSKMKYQTVPGKEGKLYKYYYCPSCKRWHANRIPLESLIETARITLQAYIGTTVAQLKDLIEDVGSEEICEIEMKQIRKRIVELEEQRRKIIKNLETVSRDYVEGFISKEEAAEYREAYDERLDNTEYALSDLESEIESLDADFLDKKDKIDFFLSYQDFEDLDRELVVILFSRVKVFSKTKIEFEFSWDDEFNHYFTLLSQSQEGGLKHA